MHLLRESCLHRPPGVHILGTEAQVLFFTHPVVRLRLTFQSRSLAQAVRGGKKRASLSGPLLSDKDFLVPGFQRPGPDGAPSASETGQGGGTLSFPFAACSAVRQPNAPSPMIGRPFENWAAVGLDAADQRGHWMDRDCPSMVF